MTTRRQQRVAEQVRHELSKLIEHEIDDPRLELISITDVTISPDLYNANVYVSSLQGEATRDDVLAGLEHARKFLRHGLAERLKLRVVPNLHFHWDKSLETGDRISRLIDQIEEAGAQQGDASARALYSHPCPRLCPTRPPSSNVFSRPAASCSLCTFHLTATPLAACWAWPMRSARRARPLPRRVLTPFAIASPCCLAMLPWSLKPLVRSI